MLRVRHLFTKFSKQFFYTVSALVIFIAPFFTTPFAHAANATIAVDGNQRFQTMDGFGVNINSHSWNNGALKPTLDMLIDQNGSRLFRVVMEMQDWEQANDNSDPNTYNWAYYNPIYDGTTTYDTAYAGSNFGDLWNTIDYLHSKGIPDSQIILSNMGPGPSWNGGSTITTQTQLNEWVEEVTSEAYWGYSHGHTFGLFSPNNEMDITSNEGITMSSTLYANGLNQISQRLDTLGMSAVHFVAPDVANIGDFSGYATAMEQYPAVMSKVDHFGAHDYFGNTGSADSIATSAGKNFWMDEFSIFDQAFSLLNQNASAVLMWDGYDSVYNHAIVNGKGTSPGNDAGNAPALIAYNASTQVYTPRPSFYQFEQLYKYVPIGAQRVSATSSDSTIDTVAFTHSPSGRFTLVGDNTSTSAKTISISLANIANLPTSLSYFQTNSTSNMAQGADVAISGGTATVTVPASTVFTLTGTAVVDTTPPSTPSTLTASGNIGSATLNWTGSTDNVGVTQYNVYRSTTSGFTPSAANKIGQSAGTSYTDNGLTAGTYYYQVTAQDAAGNISPPSNEANATVTSDTTPPVVSLTNPVNGTTVGGTVSVTANASDNVSVAGVQFKLDGTNLGSEVTTSPYATNWNTTTATNGSHTLTAVARDASGNTTTATSVTVTVNNTSGVTLLGSQTVQSAADSNSSGEAEAFKYTATASGTAGSIKFYVDNGSAATSLKVGIYSANGSHAGTLLASGSIASPAAGAWNTVTLTSGTNLTSGTTYWIGFLGTGGTLAYRDLSSGSCSESASASGLSALPTTWSAGQTWLSCTLSAYVVSTSSPDTTAPTVSITAPTNGATVSGTVSVAANASDNVGVAGVQFKLDGANLGSEVTALPYSLNWNTTSVADGTHTLTAVARDAAGNTTTSSSVTVTVSNADTTPPATSISSPANNATIGGKTVAVNATASDNVGVTKVELYVDSALTATDTASPYNFTLDTTGLSNGAHTLTTKAYDAANNVGTSTPISVTVFNDTSAPTVPTNLSATATGMTSVALSWTASTDNVGVTGYHVFRNGTQIATATTTSYTDTGLTSGTSYTYTVTAFDAAGNESAQSPSASATTNTDTTPPTIPTNLTQSAATATTATLSWTASTDNVGVTGYTYYLSVVPSGTTNGTSVTYTGLTCGTSYAVGVEAYDAAGNVSPRANTTLTTSACDSTPPSVSISAPSNGSTVAGTVSVSASASDNVGVAGVQFKLDGANLGAEVTNSPYTTSWNTTSVSNGSHTLTAVARDAAGNTTTSSTVTVTVNNAPLAFDKQVTTHQSSAATSITSAALTTAQSNELLVAFITSDGPAASGGESFSSVTGGNLTWTLRKRVNTSNGTSEIWTAPASAVVTNLTVKATRASGSYRGSITVAAFINANLTSVGAVSGNASTTGAPSTSLVATHTGSMVWGVGNDWDGATSHTVGTNQTMVDQYLSTSSGDAFWVQKNNVLTTAGQTTTINDTAPTNHQWNLAAIEILPAS